METFKKTKKIIIVDQAKFDTIARERLAKLTGLYVIGISNPDCDIKVLQL